MASIAIRVILCSLLGFLLPQFLSKMAYIAIGVILCSLSGLPFPQSKMAYIDFRVLLSSLSALSVPHSLLKKTILRKKSSFALFLAFTCLILYSKYLIWPLESFCDPHSLWKMAYIVIGIILYSLSGLPLPHSLSKIAYIATTIIL